MTPATLILAISASISYDFITNRMMSLKETDLIAPGANPTNKINDSPRL
jgi:hypothetical protein